MGSMRFDKATVRPVTALCLMVTPSLAACGEGATGIDDGTDPTPPAGSVAAFPGAEGFGAGSVGGRGGAVIAVTSLEDSGPGSLRDAVETKGPRTIIFHVGGTITLRSPLEISEPFVTIAGQKAPGGGIALRGDGSFGRSLLEITTHDVVLRHVRLRPGSDALPNGSCCRDALSIRGTGAFNVMVDHVSASCAVDEVAQIFDGPRDVTIQWSIMVEGLYCSNHNKTIGSRGGNGPCPEGADPHSRGLTISHTPETGTPPDRISLHRNLWANSEIRFPNVFSSTTLIDVANNVIYNFSDGASHLGIKDPGPPLRANFRNNTYRPGPINMARGPKRALIVTPPTFQEQAFEIYWEGNIVTQPILPAWDAWESDEAEHRVSAPHEVETVTMTSAAVAFDAVLAGVGATLPARDAADARIIGEVASASGGFVDHPDDVGGWPSLGSGTPPPDSDADGMPDAWETGHGFDPSDAADGPRDADGDGYTNLEEYLNDTNPLSSSH